MPIDIYTYDTNYFNEKAFTFSIDIYKKKSFRLLSKTIPYLFYNFSFLIERHYGTYNLNHILIEQT